jgi:cholesterol oxidase
LSVGLETLMRKPVRDGVATPALEPLYFDVVIIGSGYGGSVAAAKLAGCVNEKGEKITVCVLERGSEYLAGMFPSGLAEMPAHLRFTTPEEGVKGERTGLFDLRLGGDVVSLVASGVGGGSLINAGVMAMPLASIFQEAAWPQAIRSDAGLLAMGDQLSARLNASPVAKPSAKTKIMQRLDNGCERIDLMPITVAHTQGANYAQVQREACLNCGDCATGCNHDAKQSLDVTLLRQAKSAGAQIVSGATVLRLERFFPKTPTQSGGWEVVLNHTASHARSRQSEPFRLRAGKVILAAGTFGSTEILMRSRCSYLELSERLGENFSANGDMIVTAHDLALKDGEGVNALASESMPPADRHVGPTITAMLDARFDDPAHSVVAQDLAVPAALRWLYEEAITTSDVLNQLAKGDCRRHDGTRMAPDQAMVNAKSMDNSLVVALIGRDSADGRLQMAGTAPPDSADGLLTVVWPQVKDDPRFERHQEWFAKKVADAQLGGRVVPNPLWRPLSEKLEDIFDRQRGPLISVHPLGGCAMGADVAKGVVDDLGRVYDASAASPVATFAGLVVLDGSIVPSSLGINPALTIAALAQRAITILAAQWNFKAPACEAKLELRTRPKFRDINGDWANFTPNAAETLIEMTEQMRGTVSLALPNGNLVDRTVEITLTTDPVSLRSLSHPTLEPDKAGQLELCTSKSRIRIINHIKEEGGSPIDPITDQPIDDTVECEFALSGHIEIFALEASGSLRRLGRALPAWFVNRGLRDIAQNIKRRWRTGKRRESNCVQMLLDTLRLCTRAGAVRLIRYDLAINESIEVNANASWSLQGFKVTGVKRITYGCASSPWTQLMALEVVEFPYLDKRPPKRPVLELNPKYLARQQVPLIRIVGQKDRVAALTDLASFVLYVCRLVLQTHLYSLRKPDAPLGRVPKRLPGEVLGLPMPQITWLDVASTNGQPERIRLARYNGMGSVQPGSPPVLMIHGYSASGTTFAHAALPGGGLAGALCRDGRDVWVLDMRSSSGMPTARGDWAFEEMALYDIRSAVVHVVENTQNGHGSGKTDVVAHCMGAAMFSMAVLMDELPAEIPPFQRYTGGKIYNRLPQMIGRVVLSQVAPALALSPANILRAYLMRYVRFFLPLEDYEFTPQSKVSLAGQIMDRVLTTLPLPKDEFKRENPFSMFDTDRPWVGTRHRIDALYARTFSLMNLTDDVLAHIDDFFGPLSVETVSQVIHFANGRVVRDRTGMNKYLMPVRSKRNLVFPILSIHGHDNGLSDKATLGLMRKAVEAAGIPWLNNTTQQPGEAQAGEAQAPLSALEMGTLIGANRLTLTEGRASYTSWCIPGYGHQDSLIGKDATDIYAVVTHYLKR